MRVLFDQATPLPIRPYLLGHEIRTAVQEGWQTLKNGDLLAAAETAGFDLLLTTDKNIRYQQDLSERKIAIVVLGQQQWPRLRPHVRLVVEAVNLARRGSYTEVEVPAEPRPPVANVEVKPRRADGTARETVWERRSSLA
jgi:hypothetical protein